MDELKTRARRAYELGRLRHGLRLALVVPPLATAHRMISQPPSSRPLISATVALTSRVSVLVMD